MQRIPGLSSSRLPNVLIATAAALALVGLGGVATGVADKPEEDVAAERVRDTTTTTDGLGGFGAGDGGDAGDVSGLPTTTVAGGRTRTTERSTTATTQKQASDAPPADCPAPPAATGDPGASSPPAVGTYEYVTCGDADEESDETKVEAKPGDANRRLITSTLGGFPQTATVLWGPNGVFQESFTIAGVATCDWDPDVLAFPPSVAVGTTWSADSKCKVTSPQGTGTIHLTASAKVTGKVSFAVGGTAVNAWVLESTAHFDISGKDAQGQPQNTAYDIVSKLYYDPVHGVDVYRHFDFKSDDGTTTLIDRLKSLTPKKNA